MKKILKYLLPVLMFVFLVLVISYAFDTPATFPPWNGCDSAYTPALNDSGGYLYNGDIVSYKTVTSTITQVTTTTTAGAPNTAGVWVVSVGTRTADGDVGRVQIYGYNPAIRICSVSAITAYDTLKSSSPAGFASGAIATLQSGFGFALETKTALYNSTSTIKGFIKGMGR